MYILKDLAPIYFVKSITNRKYRLCNEYKAVFHYILPSCAGIHHRRGSLSVASVQAEQETLGHHSLPLLLLANHVKSAVVILETSGLMTCPFEQLVSYRY